MKYRRFGRTELQVSEIGFGAWAIGGRGWGDGISDKDSMEALQKAWEEGINLFDTCDAYGDGHSEELIGKFLQGKRGKAVLVTKGGTNFRVPERSKNFSREYLLMCLDESLKRLRTDYVDVYLLHVPDAQWQEKERVFETMKEIRNSGKAKFVGLAMWGSGDIMHAFETDVDRVTDVLECPFNILNKSNPESVAAAEERDIAVMTSQPLASGILTGKYKLGTQFQKDDNRSGFWTEERWKAEEEDLKSIEECARQENLSMTQLALAFNLTWPGISCVIPGGKNAAQVQANASAAGIRLSPETMEKLKRTRGFVF